MEIKGFGYDELVSLRLRGLFEQRGFRRVRVNKFEDYALYVDNKNFLQSESIITFMDVDGKLLALKPDVTLSVVRGIPKKELLELEKLYYADEIYRLSRENREYRVHSQIGVEMFGRADSGTNIEAVTLALSALSLISNSFVLDISHLGFVSGLIEHMSLEHSVKRQVLAGIHSKSVHDIAFALAEAGVCDTDKNRLTALCGLHGDFLAQLPAAYELIVCDQMRDAYAELEQLGAALKDSNMAEHAKLDFSVVNDLDYYNGLIFSGYIEGLPKVVLTGGRYDNLMRKMDNENGAIGFAVSLDDLNTYLKPDKNLDVRVIFTDDSEVDKC